MAAVGLSGLTEAMAAHMNSPETIAAIEESCRRDQERRLADERVRDEAPGKTWVAMKSPADVEPGMMIKSPRDGGVYVIDGVFELGTMSFCKVCGKRDPERHRSMASSPGAGFAPGVCLRQEWLVEVRP